MRKQKKIELRIKQGKANTKLKLEGVDATTPIDVDNRHVQATIDGGCGVFCTDCDQYKASLCKGCYSGCHDEIRNCRTVECDKETTSYVKNKKGEMEKISGPCIVRCCKRNNLAEWIEDVSGGNNSLSIQNTRWEPFSIVDFPVFIPSLKGPVGINGLYFPYVSISLSDLYRLKSGKIASVKRTVHDLFGLHPDTKVILNAYCADPIIEKFWTTYLAKGHLQALYDKGVHYAMGFNYSVYFGHPRMEHLINIKRNFAIIEDMQKVGMKVIPDLCWFNDVDLEEYIKWINYNKVSIVGISLQLSRDDSIMARNLLDLKKLQASCPDVKKWIVNGPCKPHRIKMLLDEYRDLILMNKYAHQLATYRLVWDFESYTFVKQIDENGTVISREESLRKNCEFFTDFMQGTNFNKFDKSYFGE